MTQAALTDKQVAFLDGVPGDQHFPVHGTPLAEKARDFLLGTRLNELVDAIAAGLATQAQVDAMNAAETDGELPIAILGGTADAGTWTKAVTSGGLETVTRTANSGNHGYWIPVIIPHRTASGRGIKPTGIVANYSVNTADLDDVRFELWKVTQGADDAARTAAVLFGDDNADYDAAHNTAIERGDDSTGPELHKVTVADAGTPGFLGAGETLLLRVYVDGDAGGAGAFVLTSAVLKYTLKPMDIA